MKKFCALLILISCARAPEETLTLIQIQDRNGLTETVSSQDRLAAFKDIDFLGMQPYKKVLRVYRKEEGNRSILSSYHTNGQIYQYLEGEAMRAHGLYREWHPNGQLKAEGMVISGTLDLSDGAQMDWLFEGTSTAWDESGNKAAVITYQKGVLQGPSTYYFPSGEIQCKATFSKNARHGISETYFEGGQIAAEEHFSDGLIHNAKYYNPKGEVIATIENGGGTKASFDRDALTLMDYTMGTPQGRVLQYTATGKLKRSFYINGDRKEGEEVEYHLHSSTPKLSIMWHDYAVHGQVKSWYPNGQLQSQREFIKNKRSGPSLAWYQNGALMLVEEYEGDMLVQGQYFKINQSAPISSVTAGTGTATLYDETGTLIKKVSYLKGKPVDP